MSENLKIYNAVRKVPAEAQREIKGGRLSGKTDINPMWRIKTLTEQFGVCGFGWRYEIAKQWIEKADNGEIAAFVNIDLYVKQGGEWSAAIPGNGGSMFVAQEKNGPYVSDECFKMALTDAISVACKALGFGADVYWEKDSTKYDKPQNPPQGNKPVGNDNNPPSANQGSKNDSVQPSDIEKRATAIYFHCTGNKEGQYGWSKEKYKETLKEWKDGGFISTDYGKKWTLDDIVWIETQIDDLPF
jgi:hypothetical protein